MNDLLHDFNNFLANLDQVSCGFGIFLGWFIYHLTSGSEILWSYLDDLRKKKNQ